MAVLRRLEELFAACARTRVRLPPLAMGVLRFIDSDAFESRLHELTDDLIAPCIELVRSISWERLAVEYDRLERAHFAHSQALSRAEADFMLARQTLRSFESQLTRHVAWQARILATDASRETLEHLAQRTISLERELGDAAQAVHHYSAIFLQHSRAHEAAGTRFIGMTEYERCRRFKAEDFLTRIARALDDLSSFL